MDTSQDDLSLNLSVITNGSQSQEEDELNVTVNPSPPEALDVTDTALLRGDAIGDTVYTHRWVLSCLVSISKDLTKYLVLPDDDLQNGDGHRNKHFSCLTSWKEAVGTSDSSPYCSRAIDSLSEIDTSLKGPKEKEKVLLMDKLCDKRKESNQHETTSNSISLMKNICIKDDSESDTKSNTSDISETGLNVMVKSCSSIDSNYRDSKSILDNNSLKLMAANNESDNNDVNNSLQNVCNKNKLNKTNVNHNKFMNDSFNKDDVKMSCDNNINNTNNCNNINSRDSTTNNYDKITENDTNGGDVNEGSLLQVIELESDVEEAACQLWDMTVERDVSMHLLSLQDVDFLQLATHIISYSRAPRLTEVVVGITANICCQKEGCERVLSEATGEMQSIVRLLSSTSDVPTLCEVVRLFRLLLWHRVHNKKLQSRTTCTFIASLQSPDTSNTIMFLLKNSLNEQLVEGLTELLESLLYLWLPHEDCYLNTYYASQDMIEGLSELLVQMAAVWAKSGHGEKDSAIVHRIIICLYAFVDTSAVTFIQKQEANNDYLEKIFHQYIEKISNIDNSEQLIGTSADRLTLSVGFCQLFIPNLRHPNLLLSVAHLMALTHGHVHHYSASRSSSTEEDAQFTDGVPGWLSPIGSPLPSASRFSSKSSCIAENLDSNSSPDSETTCIDELKELEGALGDYCLQVVSWWWMQENIPNKLEKQEAILNVFDQCHANEVVLVFNAIRSRQPSLVPMLQECMLDKGTHTRLVAILAHMYQ